MSQTVSSDKELQTVVRRRAKKLWRRLSESRKRVLREADADSIHDLRVASRRIQTLIDVSSLPQRSKSSVKFRKRIKRLRHAAGGRRDVEVMLDKLRAETRGSATARRRRLLRSVARSLAPGSKWQSQQVRRKIKKIGGGKLHRLCRRSLLSGHSEGISIGTLRDAIEQAEHKWLSTVDDAIAHDDPGAYHDVRIKAKTLRYAIELAARFIDVADADAIIEWLKSIQNELGEWHDEVEECRRVTEILSRGPGAQSDPAATALIRSLRSRTEAHTRFVRDRLRSLQGNLNKRGDRPLFLNGRGGRAAPVLEIIAL